MLRRLLVGTVVHSAFFFCSVCFAATITVDQGGVGDHADIQDATQVVDGNWALVNGGIRTAELGYDRVLDFGDMTWNDYEVTAPITIYGIDPAGFSPTSGNPGFGFTARWNGHTDDPVVCSQPRCGWLPSGGARNRRGPDVAPLRAP